MNSIHTQGAELERLLAERTAELAGWKARAEFAEAEHQVTRERADQWRRERDHARRELAEARAERAA